MAQADLEKHSNPRNKKLYTPAATRQHKEYVENCFVSGLTINRICVLARKEFDIGPKRTMRLLEEVKKQFTREDDVTRDHNRATAIRRIKRKIQELNMLLLNEKQVQVKRGKKNVIVAMPRSDNDIVKIHTALEKWERLLTSLEGTMKPLQISIDVQVSQAVLAVIAGMSAEDVTLELTRHSEMEQEAKLYRAMTGKGKAA